MGKAPAFQFYPGDWRRDTQVQMATMETRGVWFELLCCMWFAPERGKIEGEKKEICRMIGCDIETFERSLKEINKLKIADVTNCNINVTIINRRMYREQKQRESTRLRVKKHRVTKSSNTNITPPSPTPSSSTPSSTLKELPKGSLRTKPCSHQKIIDQYHKILPTLPNIQVWDKTSKQNLKARWLEDEIRQDIEFWKTYFAWVAESKFLLGDNDRGWVADLHWLVKPANFAKTINGRYHKNQNLTDRLKEVGYKWLEKKKKQDSAL